MGLIPSATAELRPHPRPFDLRLDMIASNSYIKHLMSVTPDFSWQEVGDRIRQRRLARRMTQQTLAERAGLTQNGIFRIEAGGTNPQLNTLQQIAAGLGCNVRELLCGLSDSTAEINQWFSRGRAVIDSGDDEAIRLLLHGIEAAEALLERSDRRRSMRPPTRQIILKGERRSMAEDLVLNQPLVRGRSDADDMPPKSGPEWIKVGQRISRRSKAKHETK